LAGFLLLATIPTSGQAQQLSFRLSPAHTQITFTLADILHTIHGSFNLRNGDLQYDTKSALVRGSLAIDATSGRSGNRTRDRRMHGEILETARYPDIVFHPDRVDGQVASSGVSNLQVHGIVSIRGGEHELTVPLRMQMFADHWVADSHFTVPYVKWGIKNPSRLMLRVSESVEIDVHASGVSP
jgi:polyisoprenoid-binding protein YceI